MILDRTVRIVSGLSAVFLIFCLSKDYGAASMYISPQHVSEAICQSSSLSTVHSKGVPVANLIPTPFQETSVGQLYSAGCDWEELSRNHQIFGFPHFYQNQDLVDSPGDNPNSEKFSNAQDSSTRYVEHRSTSKSTVKPQLTNKFNLVNQQNSSRPFEVSREKISASEGARAQLPVEDNNIDRSESPAAGLSGEQGPRQILESSSQIMDKSGEPPSNRVHNRNERCKPENVPPNETKCSKRKEGNFQKDEPNNSKKKKILVKKLYEGSPVVPSKAGRLSGAPETNHEVQLFSSTSGESNFPSSEKNPFGKSALSALQIVERLRNIGKIHVENLPDFKEIALFFSKVKNIPAKSLLKVCQGKTPEKKKDTVLRSMKRLINSFVGLIGAWCDLGGSVHYETGMKSAWNFVQQYFSRWIDAQNIGEKVTECRDDFFDGIMPFEDYMANTNSGKNTFDVQICYQLWTGWLNQQNLTKYLAPFKKFTRKLQEIKKRATEITPNQNPETPQPLDFWEFTLGVARANKENGVGSYQYRLVEEGKNLDGPWVKSRQKLEEYVAKTTEKIFSEVKMIKTSTKGGRMKPKRPIFEERPSYKGQSTKPANVQKRVVENIVGRTLPAFLGFVRRLNIRSGGDGKEEIMVLNRSIEFIRGLINEWKKFDYIEMLTSKISEPRQTEEINPNQIHDQLIAEKLFWNAAFPDTKLGLPATLLFEIAKQWAKEYAGSGKGLRVYVLEEEEEFNTTFYGRGKPKPQLKRLFEDDPAEKEPNKSQSGQSKKASGSKRPRLNPLEG